METSEYKKSEYMNNINNELKLRYIQFKREKHKNDYKKIVVNESEKLPVYNRIKYTGLELCIKRVNSKCYEIVVFNAIKINSNKQNLLKDISYLIDICNVSNKSISLILDFKTVSIEKLKKVRSVKRFQKYAKHNTSDFSSVESKAIRKMLKKEYNDLYESNKDLIYKFLAHNTQYTKTDILKRLYDFKNYKNYNKNYTNKNAKIDKLYFNLVDRILMFKQGNKYPIFKNINRQYFDIDIVIEYYQKYELDRFDLKYF